jgi:hypothetical protein
MQYEVYLTKTVHLFVEADNSDDAANLALLEADTDNSWGNAPADLYSVDEVDED